MPDPVISLSHEIEHLNIDRNLPQRARNRLAEVDHVSLPHHAQTRRQQRGISQSQISLAILFGKQRPATSKNLPSAYSYSFDHASLSQLKQFLGDAYPHYSDRLNFYVVLDKDSHNLITCAHRLRKAPHA